VCIIHIPIFRDKSKMDLWNYIPTPIIGKSSPTYTTSIIDLDQPILRYNNQTGRFISMSVSTLNQCLHNGDHYFCHFHNIVQKLLANSTHQPCLVTLFQGSKGIPTTCHEYLSFYNYEPTFVTQLNPNTFYIFTPHPKSLNIECLHPNLPHQTNNIMGHTTITLPTSCVAQTDDFILTPESSVVTTTPTKILNINSTFNLSDIFSDNDVLRLSTAIDEIHHIIQTPVKL